jgi:hypothetical protein
MKGSEVMEEKGVWKTISGRRVFIKEGQSLTDAMKNSGKFENKLGVEIQNKQLELFNKQTLSRINELEDELKPEKIKEFKEIHESEIKRYVTKIDDYERKVKNNEKLKPWETEKNNNVLKSNIEFHKRQIEGHEYFIKEEIAKANETINKIGEFQKIVNENNLIITKSPYSDSFYAIKDGEKIDWGTKPEGSYRLADHWNWDDGTHCPTDTNQDFGLAIAQQRNGKYTKIS